MTLSEKLDLSRGRPTGFDYLRLVLALGVVCMHSALTSYGQAADYALWASPLRPAVRLILPMFFALSGFLVAGSLFRAEHIGQFLWLRVIRIYPALAVEVFLSALLLGPILTTVPLQDYFLSREFALYIANVSGEIHFTLPGVFLHNSFPRTVNAQLWTVPFELGCYLTLSALTLVGIKRARWIAPAAMLLMMAAYFVYRTIKHQHESQFILGGLPGFLLIVSFLAGVGLYLYRDRVPWSYGLTAAAGVVSAILLVAPFGDYVVVPIAAYFTVGLGLLNPRKLFLLKGADYSYGIFLYGFVIQQTLMYLLPWARLWWINILLAVPTAAAFAALSWYLVERPALELRTLLVKKAPRIPDIRANEAQANPAPLGS